MNQYCMKSKPVICQIHNGLLRGSSIFKGSGVFNAQFIFARYSKLDTDIKAAWIALLIIRRSILQCNRVIAFRNKAPLALIKSVGSAVQTERP